MPDVRIKKPIRVSQMNWCFLTPKVKMKLNLKRCAKRLQRKLAFRQNGFLRAMEQTSLSIDPAYIGHLKGEVDIESVVSVIEKIFVPNHFPTAIFCCSDEAAKIQTRKRR